MDIAVRRRVGLVAAIAVATLVADAVSKHIVVAKLTNHDPVTLIPSVLDLELTRNSGAAFSVGTGSTIIFTAVALAVVVAIVRVAPRLVSSRWAAVLGGLLGGALGNLADRLFRSPGVGRGEVIDWIHLHHWPVFNVADMGISIGGVAAVLLAIMNVPATAPKETVDG